MKIIKNAELEQIECPICSAILLPTLKDLKKSVFGDKTKVICPICTCLIPAKFKRHKNNEESM